jgi:hypothetical protein
LVIGIGSLCSLGFRARLWLRFIELMVQTDSLSQPDAYDPEGGIETR